MTTPVLVVTGYLGAGKTTLINNLLANAEGRRIAAVVNDFGAINIDEELIAESADSVVGLANGCICCTMQGDLLRTLKLLLGRDPAPDHIVVEASGVADPSGILQALSDPVLWKSARLDAVVCVVDAQDVSETPERKTDELWRAQLAAANFLILSKSSGLEQGEVSELAASLAPRGKPPIFDTDREVLPTDLLLDSGRPANSSFLASEASTPLRSDRFCKVEWQVDTPISLQKLQALIADFASSLVRVKGILRFHEKAGSGYLLQMVGQRVTLERFNGACREDSRLVMIGETGRLDRERLVARLDDLGRIGVLPREAGAS